MPTKTGVARVRMDEMATPGDEIAPVHIINTCFGVVQDAPAGRMGQAAQGDDPGLSVRAINVLKILAGEIMGGVPERAGWVPPEKTRPCFARSPWSGCRRREIADRGRSTKSFAGPKRVA